MQARVQNKPSEIPGEIDRAPYKRLLQLTDKKTKEELQTQNELKTGIEGVVLKVRDKYIKLDKVIGGGFWSFVFLGYEYDINTGQVDKNKKHVLKMLKPNPAQANIEWYEKVLHMLAESKVNTLEQFRTEFAIYRLLHPDKFSELVEFEIDGKSASFLFMPHLGNLSLEQLMEKKWDMIERIPMREWMRFFLIVVTKLREFHEKTKSLDNDGKPYLHNDIKPGNIIFSLELDPDTLLYRFTDINLIDFGNAHKLGECGHIGDPRYQNPIKPYVGTVLKGVKDEMIDVNAMGNTLLKLSKMIRLFLLHPKDQEMLELCMKEVFSEMDALFSHKMGTSRTIEFLNTYNENYRIVAAEVKDEFADELQDLLNSLKAKSSNNNTCHLKTASKNCFFSPQEEVSLSTRIRAAQRLLDMAINDKEGLNEEIVFEPQEIEALDLPEFNGIIRKYRQHEKLPTQFMDFDRSSMDIHPARHVQVTRSRSAP